MISQIRLSSEQSVAAPVAEHVRKVEAEVDVLKQLQHANIVRYLVSSLFHQPGTEAVTLPLGPQSLFHTAGIQLSASSRRTVKSHFSRVKVLHTYRARKRQRSISTSSWSMFLGDQLHPLSAHLVRPQLYSCAQAYLACHSIITRTCHGQSRLLGIARSSESL